ncbi:hypothetical protein [Streptomyces sp. NPDC021096]|uniref:hypothetical protein n=1 Tax=Streptomyces sp. NPDC021096 TaxID=3154792 RepID=UPI0033EF7B1C
MVKDGTAGVLAPLGDGLSAEKRALAENLRELFTGLGISVRRYASQRHLDAGTVSRYLNGTRVPSWDFIEGLIEDRNRQEKPVTVEVEQLLQELWRRASSPGSRAHTLQKLQDQLARANQDVRSAEHRQTVLADALQDRQRQLTGLQERLDQLEREREEGRLVYESTLAVWQDKYEDLQEQRDQLRHQVGELREALSTAKLAAHTAEKRCEELEAELDSVEEQLDASITRDSLVDALESADRMASVPQLIELVGRLNTPVRIPMATELVKAAAQVRPVTEAAALIEALYAARQHRHAEAALPAMVAFRSVYDTALLIAEFARVELIPAAAAVIQTALEIHPPKEIAVIASVLHPHDQDDLITAVLGPAITFKPLSYVMDMLRELDYLGLLGLTEQALPVCARERSVWELADLIHELESWGFGHLAERLQSGAAAHRSAKDVIDLVDALRRSGRPDNADCVLWLSTENRTTRHVAKLITALHVENLQNLAAALLSQVVREWPVDRIAGLIGDLHAAGDWHFAVTALSDAAHFLPMENFSALIKALNAGSQSSADVVLGVAGDVSPHTDVAVLITMLDQCGLSAYADKLFWRSIDRSTGHASLLVSSLRACGSRHVSHDALRSYARTRNVPDIAALGLALDSAYMRDDIHAFLVVPRTPQFLPLLCTLDELLGGPDLAERILRDVARRSSVDENVEMALALDTLPLRMDRYRAAFVDVACGKGTGKRSAFLKKLEARKKELHKQLTEKAGENVRIDRRNRHRKTARRFMRFPRPSSQRGA